MPRLSEWISGAELAASIHAQTSRLGARYSRRRRIRPKIPGNGPLLEFDLTGATTIRARAGIAANGVHYRRLKLRALTN